MGQQNSELVDIDLMELLEAHKEGDIDFINKKIKVKGKEVHLEKLNVVSAVAQQSLNDGSQDVGSNPVSNPKA